MKKAIIIALLIAQAKSMSLYDVFAPVEDSLGRLVSDVVTGIKDTIDCTILEVEHVFSLGGLFGENAEYYRRCGDQNADNDSQTDETSSDDDTQETPDESTPKPTAKEAIIEDVEVSVSDAHQQIQNIIDQSGAQAKIEKVQSTILNESERLLKISDLLKHELEKLPDEVRKKFNFYHDRPTVQDVFDEFKLLYEVEQKDKSSAEANEVRRVFHKVLNILHVNVIDDPLSDEDEVKLILSHLRKSSNATLLDIEKQVSQWTDEQNKDITKIVPITNNITLAEPKNIHDEDKAKENLLLTEKIDETEQAKMVDFSKSLKNITKTILDKVNTITVSEPGTLMDSISSNELNKHVNMTSNSKSDNLTTNGSTIPTGSSVSTISPQEQNSSTLITNEGLSTTVEMKSVSTQSMFTTSPKAVTVFSTTEFSTLTEPILGSTATQQLDQSFQTSTQKSSTEETSQFKELTSNSTESHSQTNEETYNSTVHLAIITSTDHMVQSISQENASTKQMPLMTVQHSTESNQMLESNTQTNTTTTPTSSDTVTDFSTVQSSQTSSTSIQTSQSNTQTVTTATQPPESNAQQQQIEADSQENVATAHTPQMNAQSYASTTLPADEAYQSETSKESYPTDLPKSFKEFAERLFSKNKPQSDEVDYDNRDDYSYPEYAAKDDNTGSLIEKLFSPQDKAAKQEAVENAKNLVAKSKETKSIMDKIFNNADHSASPNIFDDPSYHDY